MAVGAWALGLDPKHAMLLGAIVSSLYFLWQLLNSGVLAETYHDYRANLGRGILLGLEFLVAADIIGTVAVEPTFENLGVLGLIVVIRTFLSFALEAEINGRWPWQEGAARERRSDAADRAP